ncbi:tRNA pseudouridine synthase Pus10 [uncultured archaeon]|nr:tRNA pseudouridine synthase Pus10 [uncultured archaeon]
MEKTSEAQAKLEDGITGFAKAHEFSSFWLAVVLSSKMEAGLGEEGRLKLKSELKRSLGRKLEAKWAKKKIRAAHDNPDVLFTLDFHAGRLKTKIKPLFVYGRYLKPSREIPQSKWPCSRCNGGGCSHCGGKGAMYEETVEGFIGAPLVKQSGASGTKMHAAGREDVDARMLGTGRPFVIELEKPRKRKLNLSRARLEANRAGKGKASFSKLFPVGEKEAAKIHSVQPDKAYRVTVTCGKSVTDASLRKLLRLKGALISQRTPTRVLHRRGDLERKRRIRSVSVKNLSSKSFQLSVRVQSGTYVKELVSGDSGRTKPSVSSILGCKCVPSDLDVTRVWFRLRE